MYTKKEKWMDDWLGFSPVQVYCVHTPIIAWAVVNKYVGVEAAHSGLSALRLACP